MSALRVSLICVGIIIIVFSGIWLLTELLDAAYYAQASHHIINVTIYGMSTLLLLFIAAYTYVVIRF